MTIRLWIRIFLLLSLCLIPVAFTGFFQVREAIQVVWQLNAPDDLLPLLEESMTDQKKLNAFDPTNQGLYLDRFERIEQQRADLTALKNISQQLRKNLESQTIRNALISVLIGIFLSLFVSAKIVRDLRNLRLKEKESERHENDLKRLKGWQAVARTVVHELRSPMAPLQALAETLESKHQSLDPEQFRVYISHSGELLRQQADTMRRLIDSFTAFAKLPEPQLKDISLSDLIADFVQSHQGYIGDRATLTMSDESSSAKLKADGMLLQCLFFNLLRNALEANLDRKIHFHILIAKHEKLLTCDISNTGSPIPLHICENLFQPNSGESGMNKLGLGLSICRKISLDHSGDLELLENREGKGVTWRLRLPITI